MMMMKLKKKKDLEFIEKKWQENLKVLLKQ